ncbi:hypothetical protein HID58_022242, partial [Brassica napus]
KALEMAELQPADNSNQQPNGGVTPSVPSTSAEALAIPGGGSKRLRRPSSPVKEESLVRDRGGGGGFYGREGVKIWLQELGLGRYWPMFEIHEVDDEVLPLLTLDDLKDMGITAVGSRRKMFSAIQKLGREFS